MAHPPLHRRFDPDPPPPIAVRYFYTSLLAIDDPLAPLPPIASGSAKTKLPPRPFSTYDNGAIEKAWLEVRKKLLHEAEAQKDAVRFRDGARASQSPSAAAALANLRKGSMNEKKRRSTVEPPDSPLIQPLYVPGGDVRREERSRAGSGSVPGSYKDISSTSLPIDETSSTTGNPFIRAPVRSEAKAQDTIRARSSTLRPHPPTLDSYAWDEGAPLVGGASSPSRPSSRRRDALTKPEPSATVPVGASRLHNVVFPQLQMEPIYWSPVNDIAPVLRGTWFYAENMLPVETDVANLLESGYVSMRAWSQTWKDELNSAVEVGASGEEKIFHKLWPEKLDKQKQTSRPTTARGQEPGQAFTTIDAAEEVDPEKERQEIAASAGDLIDISTSTSSTDNKAAGISTYGKDGSVRRYANAGIIYANAKDAYILRPSLQPSHYYGRRPLASYIRKGHNIGIRVVRGFDQQAFDKIHMPKNSSARKSAAAAAAIRASIARGGDLTGQPETVPVTDLVLVIHGIGQKLSERVESYHFTHAINSFRRDISVELNEALIQATLRKDMGGIMVLPVNWRQTLSIEDGGYPEEDSEEDLVSNPFSLRDITPDTLPSVRNILSDVMLDIPYYMSREHSHKVIEAVVREANRIYNLWCLNNPGFSDNGRVHIIAHSLGSVLAVDILSNQPTRIAHDRSPNVPTPTRLSVNDHFLFDTHTLFTIGSPIGMFLLLKRAGLVPRVGRAKPGMESADRTPGVAGERGQYGCLAVDNIYNVVNPYDPVAYCLNAAVDVDYAAALRKAVVPSSAASWLSFGSPWPKKASTVGSAAVPGASLTNSLLVHPSVARLPSAVEMETHNFTREEIAEKKMFLLNDNGQIDWFLRYGGGPLEIQYLTMLGAHSSYWINRDFVRLVVREVGRMEGREGTLGEMRAVKKKRVVK